MIGFAIFLVISAVAILMVGKWIINCIADIEAIGRDGWS